MASNALIAHKTSYERQLETDAILLQVIHLQRSLNLSEVTRADFEKDQKISKDKILSLEEENTQLLCENNERAEARRRAQSTSLATVGWGDIQNFEGSNSFNNQKARLTSQFHLLISIPRLTFHREFSFHSNRRFIFHFWNAPTYQ